MKLKNVLMLGAAALLIGSAKPATFAAGVIIPAYLPLTDTTSWQVLAEDAAIMQSGSSTKYKDYWVTVNSANNGPFSNASDWATAATKFNPIRANGGKIIGYVHALESPTGTTYRPLADVKADITAWVSGYSNLDGIWIDEFYPRYEIAGPSGSTATFPNGEGAAPTDRSFLNPDGTFNANPVHPAGGYFSQLTSWIRSTYPQLKIVGNAGGWFYSNQREYSTLVDVTCSFEQNYATAANSPTNNWSGLNQDVDTQNYAQLALIHGNSSDLNGAIDQSISHGYEYFYTTDQVYTPTSNLWGALPPYFTSEVSYIASHS